MNTGNGSCHFQMIGEKMPKIKIKVLKVFCSDSGDLRMVRSEGFFSMHTMVQISSHHNPVSASCQQQLN